MKTNNGSTITREHRLVTGDDNPEVRITIPAKQDFSDADWLPCELAMPIADALIAHLPCFESLQKASIHYLWKRKATEKPRKILGMCQRPKGLLEYYSHADFIVWFAANNCCDLSRWQFEALVFHELKHARVDPKDGAVLVPHDWEGFSQELERYGVWKRDIEPIVGASAKALLLPFGWPASPQPEIVPPVVAKALSDLVAPVADGGIDSLTISTVDNSVTINREDAKRIQQNAGEQ